MLNFTARDLITIILGVILGAFLLLRVGHNLETRHYPPPGCQLAGGHWDAWNGWRCQP